MNEKVETWLRLPFVEERPEGKRPRGRRLRYAVGEHARDLKATRRAA